MQVGTEWLIDAQGCCFERLCDVQSVRRLCEQIIAELDLHVVGKGVVHQFAYPGGITAMYLLTESHLTCHTYPESGIATFNLYCCRPRAGWPWRKRLKMLLGASEVVVRCEPRGPAVECSEAVTLQQEEIDP